MKSFKSFLNEARRNANLAAQARSNALQELDKWSKSTDIHISYTKIRKIGINPRTDFSDTPLAVYAYPLKEIWQDIKTEGVANVRFAATDAKFLFVLQEVGKKLIDVSSYKFSDLNKDLKKIRNMIDDAAYEEAEKKAEKYLSSTKRQMPYRYLQYFIYASNLKRKSSSASAAYISNMLQRLGYSGFSDRTGKGEIHSAEEIQSFFLTPKSYKVVDIIEIKDIDKSDERIRDMADYLKKNANRLSDDEIIEIVSNDIRLAKYMGPPRVKVLKALVGQFQKGRWKSKQHRIVDPEYVDQGAKNYSAAEGSLHGTWLLYQYNKLPEDFLSWGLSQKDTQVSGSFVRWMIVKKYKPSMKFILDNIKYNSRLLEAATTIDKKIAREALQVHGYRYLIDSLSEKMSERDFTEVVSEIDNIDLDDFWDFNEKLGKFEYNKLLSKKNPSDADIRRVARYVQKGHRNPPMNIINGLKKRFPSFDFTQIGGWDFWK